MAVVEMEEWLETEVGDPELCVKELKNKSHGTACRYFHFRAENTCDVPQVQLAVEWDSIAAVHITTFKEWWENLPQETRKNVRRSQKRGGRG